MNSQGKLGIGTLQSVEKTSGDENHDAEAEKAADADEDSAEDDAVPAGKTEKTSAQGPQETMENQEDGEPQEVEADEGSAGEDGPIGEEAGTMVYDQSPETSGRQKVAIKCEATGCIFNRQKNCMAQEVEIEMSAEKGQVPDATSCNTYQPANP